MKLTKNEKIEASKVELEFLVDNETFEAAIARTYKKEVGKFNIPGFRKGKAPRAMIEKMYGKGVFYDGALNDILPTAYEEAVKKAKIDPVAQPEVDVTSIDEKGVLFNAKVYIKPEVSIDGYMGIEVTKEVAPVTDEELNNEIEAVRNRNSREIDANDRPAELGDTTVIDYKGFVDGVAFEGGEGKDYALKLGSGQFIPGFEDQIVGKKVDEKFDVNVTFPKEYHAKDLAGKKAVFNVKIHAITKVELPALDDDFAKDVSEFDTLAEYKKDLKSKIENRHEKEADSSVENQIVDALIEKLKADIPAPMFDQEAENFVRDYDNQLRMQGLDLKTYFQYTGLTLEKLREQFRPQAEKQVKARLALEKVVELEKITVTKKDIDGEYKRIADAYNMDVEKVKELIDSESVSADMKVKKAMDLIKENAKIVKAKKTAKKAEAVEEKKPDAKKAPAKKAETEEKKPATKKAPAKKAEAEEKKPAAKKTPVKKAEATEKKPAAKKAPAKKATK